MRAISVTSSVLTSATRGMAGYRVVQPGPRPERPVELYEFEGCPFCRKVREVLSMLDLEADVYPCPKDGPRFRRHVAERGGREQFPYLVDPNTGKALYESDEIVRYLFDRYGEGEPPRALPIGGIANVGSAVAGLWRLGRGSFYRKAEMPQRPLELWSFEASPFCRLVRETLCVLEIPYRLHNVAKGSAAREAMAARAGRVQVPYLVDPNTEVAMFESAEIVSYLERTYAR